MNEREKTNGEENAREEDYGRGERSIGEERARERESEREREREKRVRIRGEEQGGEERGERSTLGRRGGWGMAHATRHHNGIMRQRR